MSFEGFLVLPTWAYVVIALVLTHITIASVTIFLHRHQAHNALDLKPVVSHFFRFWLWLTTGTVTREWVAIHRKHHATCETADDPHSPRYKGITTVLFGGLVLYRREARNQETLAKFGQGTPDDWLERHLYAAYPSLGIALMGLIDVLLFGLPGLVIFGVQMIWIPFWAAGVINGLGHYLGYRNFETPDASTNILPWGILVGGEELHNNHHAYMASARMSNKWWEIDIGWAYIRLLAMCKLAKVKRLAPRAISKIGKRLVDRDTAQAVVSQRFFILKRYGQMVVRPALREAKRNTDRMGRRLIRRARRLMTREGIPSDPRSVQTIDRVLLQDETLATIYRFRQQLKEVWTRGSKEEPGRVERLRAWCAACEQSGIEALEDFAAYLRGYQLVNT
ncbi:MAG: fatty acid desaturase [Gammaproteobacteria bacterium]|nr:fatty acid desaturase [Gammaproteobacteria bacterium]MDH3857082.1 fatty acid desaturase [Gammaproteobacteria bacterium]